MDVCVGELGSQMKREEDSDSKTPKTHCSQREKNGRTKSKKKTNACLKLNGCTCGESRPSVSYHVCWLSDEARASRKTLILKCYSFQQGEINGRKRRRMRILHKGYVLNTKQMSRGWFPNIGTSKTAWIRMKYFIIHRIYHNTLFLFLFHKSRKPVKDVWEKNHCTIEPFIFYRFILLLF